MTDKPHPKTNQVSNDSVTSDSATSMTEAELLAELLKLLHQPDRVQSASASDSIDSIAAPFHSPPFHSSTQIEHPVAPPVVSQQKPSAAPPTAIPSHVDPPTAAAVDPVLAAAAPPAADSAEAAQPAPVPAPETILPRANRAANHRVASSTEEAAFIELQKLLFDFDQTQLNQLRERLENPERRAADVSQVLRQAIQLQTLDTDQHPLLVKTVVPTVEQAIQESVHTNELVIADAIFPIMGPAIRKAIATALESTMQALDQMLEQSLSPRALQWKLESIRTGKSFTEVVLLRTLLYRVEQVFLIHRPTGLLLQHVVAPAIATQDPDLVSSMLQAITDFMQDSFTVQSGDTLETLRFGDLTIWIEQGPQAVLAGVLRGQAPIELRLVFRRAIERIHQELGLSLAAFQGDAAPFVAARPHLEACFQTEYKTPQSKKGRPYFWVFFACIVSTVGFLGYREWQSRQHWAAYLQHLSDEPGIVVTSAERRWGSFFITGLRDPLAVDPATLMPDSQIDPKTVVSQWQPYLSLHPKLLEARAKRILQPPATVSLSVNDAGVLSATGSAPLRWIEDSRKLVRAIPGITQFKDKVAIADLQALGASRSRIESQVLQFEQGSTTVLANPQSLDALVRELQTLVQLATLLHRHVDVEIVGRASQDGPPAQNLLLSQNRANAVLETLVSKGVDPNILTAIGIGTRQPLSSAQGSSEQINRSVTFNVLITTAPYQRMGKP